MENGLKLWKYQIQRDLMSHRDQICPAKHKPSEIFAEWKGEQAVGIGSSD